MTERGENERGENERGENERGENERGKKGRSVQTDELRGGARAERGARAGYGKARGVLVAALAAVLVLAQAADGTTARAQCPDGAELCNRVGADGKGILAGGILGAEIGFMIPAIIVGAGVREFDEAWAYIVFPVAFAGLGALGGYFALEDPTTMNDMGVVQQGFPEVAVAMLAVSIALIVPTFVGVLALTAYSPGADDGAGASGDEDAGAGGEPDESPEQSALRRTLAGGPGLLRFDRGQVLLGVPMVGGAPTFTAEETARTGLVGQDVRVPVVSGVF